MSKTMTENEAQTSRRQFLKGMVMTSGAATLGTLLLQVQADDAREEVQGPESASPSKGYRLTRHIRDYYRTARL